MWQSVLRHWATRSTPHRSTAKYLQEHGVNALRVNKISQESPNVMDLILGHKIDLVIDTPTQGNGDKTP